ncbi:MAG: hypothetical protein CL681_01605 [Blastopirellula sp.]|nr:hypothetical protein [Blastopirellula sp.]
MSEGWLKDCNGYWHVRFHRDKTAWASDPRVFIDYGRPLADEPALLKSRRRLRFDDATALWKALKESGWTISPPAWGAHLEP